MEVFPQNSVAGRRKGPQKLVILQMGPLSSKITEFQEYFVLVRVYPPYVI